MLINMEKVKFAVIKMILEIVFIIIIGTAN